jgi:hypothetical protein
MDRRQAEQNNLRVIITLGAIDLRHAGRDDYIQPQHALATDQTLREPIMSTNASGANDAGRPQPACRRCGRELHPGRGDLYVVSILAVADPSPPIFTEDDLSDDIGAEILRLTAQMSRLDAEQAQDQVYRRLVLHLCSSCYQQWIEDPTG